jgi:CRP/FNR family transcriptional regulator, cyclic AMP receptor protein
MATVPGEEKVGALRNVRLFRELDDPELRTIADQADLRKTEANETLAKEGHIGHELILIVDGTARVETEGKILHRFAPGDFFGEISLLDGKPRTATVIAETPGTIVTISRDEFLSLLDTVPGLAKKILIRVCTHLRERTDLLENNRPGHGRRFFTD